MPRLGATNVTIHPSGPLYPKTHWEIQRVGLLTRTLIVADSQFKAIKGLPDDCEVHVFPGAKLSHVVAILGRLSKKLGTTGPRLQNIIIHVGINNRDLAWSGTVVDLNKLTLLLLSKLPEPLKGYFMGVSIPPEIPQHEKATLSQINDRAKSRMGEQYIDPLPTDKVSVDPLDFYKIHYDRSTLDSISGILCQSFLSMTPPHPKRLSL